MISVGSVVRSVIGGGDFALLPRLFDNSDEHIFHRETSFLHLDDANAARLQFFGSGSRPACRVLIGNDVQPDCRTARLAIARYPS